MVSGTIAGELSALSSLPRNATCIVEHHATLWKMSMQDLDKLRRDEPALSAWFIQLILKGEALQCSLHVICTDLSSLFFHISWKNRL